VRFSWSVRKKTGEPIRTEIFRRIGNEIDASVTAALRHPRWKTKAG
jgi:hypothetical protein